MSSSVSGFVSRRDFLRAAGGTTFLAFRPAADQRAFVVPAIDGAARLPLFTVLPYIQPGPGSTLADGQESMMVAWQTHPQAADFRVDYGSTPRYGEVARVDHTPRISGRGGDVEGRFNWTATLDRLRLGQKYYYRVRATDQQHPDFVMNCGDNVYDSGPLKFRPDGPGKSGAVAGKDRRVPGTFTIDTTFDGAQHTRPAGILYIVTGAGGKHLYDPGYTDAPERDRSDHRDEVLSGDNP